MGRIFQTWREAARRGSRREDGRWGERVLNRHEIASVNHAAHAGVVLAAAALFLALMEKMSGRVR
jgi:hypothetical protein